MTAAEIAMRSKVERAQAYLGRLHVRQEGIRRRAQPGDVVRQLDASTVALLDQLVRNAEADLQRCRDQPSTALRALRAEHLAVQLDIARMHRALGFVPGYLAAA